MMPPHQVPPQPPANGVAKEISEGTSTSAQNQAQQPPLGRNSSAGDSQPQLAARQVSGGARPLPFGGANGGTEDPKPPPMAAAPAAPNADSPSAGASAQAASFRAGFGGPPPTQRHVTNPPPHPLNQPRPYMDMPLHVAAGAVSGGANIPPGIRSGASMGAGAAAAAVMAQQASLPPQPAARHPAAEAAGSAVARTVPPPAAANAARPPAPPAAPRPPPPPGGGGMRELRVEDALLYLDDVKREFGDRPRVYNEFLAIMKNFKSQEVDTPGVIARVSKLFRGYNNLILGFNKFLPDGYKISLEDLEIQERNWVRDEAAAAAASAARLGAPPQQPAQPAAPVPPQPVYKPPPQARPAATPAAIAQQQQPARPPMKPAEPLRRTPVEQMVVARPSQPQVQPAQNLATRPSVKYPPQPAAPPVKPRAQPPAPPQPPRQPPMPVQRAPAPDPSANPQQQHQAVEFDHAISYVTTIKRRFANDPSTYHAFLEILHTYQKEQRGIKEVLEQVAHLFQDHPDLLKEFTFFLPDAVQEQAKERLHRAAADSEARMAAQSAQRAQQEQPKSGGDEMEVEQPAKAQHKFIDMTGQQVAEPEPSSRSRKRSHKESTQEAPVPIQLPQQPESYVYNSAVERQFFDAAREALASYTRDGGQAWAEFLKCLDMYAQEILSRSEMLNFVEPLLGKRNNKLFEEFKRIISSAGAQSGSTPSMEDSWYSVPLSEIDFSRCRRCSPSYRALPRDYPAPPCSERNDEEAKVLNNVWVSLPVGSEESYTFRHMRRNTYEEILFRCEDERFEIDMVIDSNAVTLARLEPIAEEIAQLAENELIMPENGTSPRPASSDQGMGGKRFQYTFDKSILGVIHRNSVARIYGDAGQEILDLIVKNPTVAVPVVVQRLRQKDKEWRVVRDRMNRRWRELAEHNYYRSLDHRSLTWRTTDKRAISTRTLVSEIKDRAAHGGKEGAVLLQARLDKAKEEHGTFYETTMGSAFYRQLDLTNLPKPDRRLFTPHMSLMYENTSWVHRDAYRILSFALERGTISPADKERCHRLWFDFLGPWFKLSLSWMMSPAVNFQETTKPVSRKDLTRIIRNGDESPVEDDEEESLDEDAAMGARVVTEHVRKIKPNEKDSKPSYMDHHPLPVGATVCTLYGEGRIIKCRRADDTYVVRLAFGIAYLRPTAVLCSVLDAEKSAYTSQLRADDRTKLERPSDMLAIGTQSVYLFFRLHQILVRRLGIARQLAYNVKDDGSLINMVEQMTGNDAAALGKRRYDAYLSLVFSLLDGGTMSGSAAEGGKYEDRVRCLLGHGSYELATMDKLISHIMKNLQSMANDDTMWNLVQLYRRHLDAGGFKPEAFRQEAAYLSDGEAMYAFQKCPVQKDGGGKSVLHFEYLGVIAEAEEEDVAMAEPAVEVPVVKRQKRER